MASTTIHTLSYKMVADTQQFTRGLVATKSEVALLKKVMGDTTPEQKAQDAIVKLHRLYDRGKLTAEQYDNALKKVRAELASVGKATEPAAKSVDAFGKSLKNVVAGYVSLQTVRTGVAMFSDTLKRLDDQQDNAERFGMFVDDFIKLQYALERGGDLQAGGGANAIKTMRDNIQLAAMDMGRFKELFSNLGADQDVIAAISFMPIQKQFETMIDIINQIPDTGKRGLVAAKLFGTDEGQMASLVNGGVEGIRKLYEEAKEFGLLQGNDVKLISDTAEKWKDVAFRWQGVLKELTVALIPVAEKLAEIAKKLFGTTNVGEFKKLSDAEFMASQTVKGMNKFRDNKGEFVRAVTGKLNQSQLEAFFEQARLLDPNFGQNTLTPVQSKRLFNSALPGNVEGSQSQVQMAILEELKKQVTASQELLRHAEQRAGEQRNGLTLE